MSHYLIILGLLLALPGSATGKEQAPLHPVGTLTCKVLPHTGLNLLIHSTRMLRCTFTPRDGGETSAFKGETGVRLGLDIGLNAQARLRYSVLARSARIRSADLAGQYHGAGGSLSLGFTFGNTAPIRKRDGSIVLQPIESSHQGISGSTGFTYLYLEPATQR